MKYIDNEHELFYEQKLKELERSDVYQKALIYTLGISPITREHFSEIFNVKSNKINISAIDKPYQTTTSRKVTRLAFNLFGNICYDSEENMNKARTDCYTVSQIFCTSYAPYFYEAIKIKYPEYTDTNNTLNTISNVIELVRNKYNNKITMIIQNDELILEYLYTISGDRDCFKSMIIKEFDKKLSVEFVMQHISLLIDIWQLEDIFEILDKQSHQKPHNLKEIEAIKKKYAVGTKIKLIKMYDIQAPKPNTTGTVINVDDIGQIHVDWENGSTLALHFGTDIFEIIEED